MKYLQALFRPLFAALFAVGSAAKDVPAEIEFKSTPKLINEMVGFASIGERYGTETTTGGEGGQIVVVDNLLDFIKYISSRDPLIILIDGMVDLCSCDLNLLIESDKTILGIGDKSGFQYGSLKISGVKYEYRRALRATASSSGRLLLEANGDSDTCEKCGFYTDFIDQVRQGDKSLSRYDEDIINLPKGANVTGNIILRNLNFRDCERDCIGIENFAHHIWIDHNTFQNPADGAIDIKRGSDLVTVSWNHFSDAHKTLILGHNDDNVKQDKGKLRVTYHHNYFEGTDQRNPRVTIAEPVHIYNNFYQNNQQYAIAGVTGAGVVVEGNYFEGVTKPTRSVMKAAPIPGRIVERDNFYDSFSPAPTETANVSVEEPNEYYDYEMHAASEVPEVVERWGGTGVIY